MILFAEQRPDLFTRLGLAERTHKGIVTKHAGHIFQGAQMIPGPILRRHQQDEHVHRFTVEAIETNARPRQGHRAYKALDTLVFGMGYGHTAPNSGRAQKFALKDRLDDFFGVTRFEKTPPPKLPTISRIADSLLIAVNSGIMASRTTKSVMHARFSFHPAVNFTPARAA